MFEKLHAKQGEGNVVHGLLAAHWLADEFNRTLCISPSYGSFLSAFRPKQNPVGVSVCRDADTAITTKPPRRQDYLDNRVAFVSFLSRPSTGTDDCQVWKKLASNRTVLWFTGNTYPRYWPDDAHFPSHLLFDNLYEPTEALRQLLPWHPNDSTNGNNTIPYDDDNDNGATNTRTRLDREPPRVVVHWRHGDNDKDIRRGLDKRTRQVLREQLPPDAYLCTNWVEWYHEWNKDRHAPWDTVTHSALRTVQWGHDDNSSTTTTNRLAVSTSPRAGQNLQLWSDWYTILRADQVYHTHSDFSASAVHWSNKTDSYIVRGLQVHTNDSQGGPRLDLRPERWRRREQQQRGGGAPTIVKRRLPFSQRPNQELWNCDGPTIHS